MGWPECWLLAAHTLNVSDETPLSLGKPAEAVTKMEASALSNAKTSRLAVWTSILTLAMITSVMAQLETPAENTGDRDRYMTNANGQMVAVVSPVDGEAEIVLRGGEGESKLIGFGDTVPGIENLPDGADPNDIGQAYGPMVGAGHPVINNSGVIASKVVLSSENVDGRYNDSALVVGTPGNLTTIAHTFTEVGDDVICEIEPMPQINQNGQVFFSATLFVPNANFPEQPDRCNRDGGYVENNNTYRATKAVFRYTPGVGIERLLEAAARGGVGDVVVTSDSRWVSEETTYEVVDAHLIAHSHNAVTNGGAAFVYAWLMEAGDPDFDTDLNIFRANNRNAILYLDGGDPQLVAATERRANDNTTPPVSSDFGYLGKLAADQSGRVIFKTALSDDDLNCPDEGSAPWPVEAYCYADGVPSQLYVFNPNEGLSTTPLVGSGDVVPETTAQTFNGFPPLMSTNETGAVAFTAGLNIPEICDQAYNSNGAPVDAPPDGFGTNNWADFCKGVYVATPSGTVVEIARNTRAALADEGAGASTWISEDGSETFNFDEIAATAIMGRDGSSVYFVAAMEEDQSDPIDPENEPYNAQKFKSYGDNPARRGIFVKRGGDPIKKVIAEGDIAVLGEADQVWNDLPTVTLQQKSTLWERVAGWFGIAPAYAQATGQEARLMRLFLPQPQLRQHEGTGGFSFTVRAWFDVPVDGVYDGQADFDSMVNIDQSQAAPVPVPVNSNYLIGILGVMFILLGGWLLRARA